MWKRNKNHDNRLSNEALTPKQRINGYKPIRINELGTLFQPNTAIRVDEITCNTVNSRNETSNQMRIMQKPSERRWNKQHKTCFSNYYEKTPLIVFTHW